MGYTLCGLPVYATIRDPVDQILSHYWKRRHEITIKQYIHERVPCLNHHHEHIDRFFIYKTGLQSIFEQLGYPGVIADRVGVSGTDRAILTPSAIELIKKTFPKDVALYELTIEENK